jgi:hypothetical protein
MAMKLMKKAVPQTRAGRRKALINICLIQILPATQNELVKPTMHQKMSEGRS